MTTLSMFPRIATSEFRQACHSLSEQFSRDGSSQTEWLSVQTAQCHDTQFIKIVKPLPTSPTLPCHGQDNDDAQPVSEDEVL